jgi:hypothetical protein
MAEHKKEEVQKILTDLPHFSHVHCVVAKIDSEHYLLRVPLADR